MKILGLDTSTLTSGIAVVVDDQVVTEVRHDASNRTADLLVAIDACCKQAGIAPMELDAVAIGAGPGSFTGLRIGMATAKGIAFAAGKPLWAVSSLAALAHDGAAQLANQQLFPFLDGMIAAVLDARRGEVYAGIYDAQTMQLVGAERVMSPKDLVAWVTDLAVGRLVSYVGDALAVHADVLAPVASGWMTTTPSGLGVTTVALAGDRVDVLVTGGPAYIRLAEAEVMYPDGIPGAMRKRP